MPAPMVKTVRFDRLVVHAGSSFSVGLSGSNLTLEMFFDVRFISPESNEPALLIPPRIGAELSRHRQMCGQAIGRRSMSILIWKRTVFLAMVDGPTRVGFLIMA